MTRSKSLTSKRRKATLKTLEKRRQMSHLPDQSRWFHSILPFKASTGGVAPLIPLLTMSVGGGPADVGTVNALGSTASMFGGLFWGKLSDHLNRRKSFLLAGFLGTALSTLLFSVAKSVHDVMLINVLYTFFITATVPVPVLIITKVFRFEDWERAIGRFNEVGGWAWVAGMVLGLLMSRVLGIREVFIVFGFLCFFSLPWGARTIREVPLHVDRRVLGVYAGYVVEKFRYIPNMLTHLPGLPSEGMRGLYVSSFVFWFAAMLYFTQFPVLLKATGFNGTTLYAMSIGNSSISAFMYTRVGRMLKGRNVYKALAGGLLIRAISFGLMLLSLDVRGYAFLIVAFTSYLLAGYTWAFIGVSTTAMISKNSGGRERGSKIGTYNLVSSLGAIVGNFTSGVIVEQLGFEVDFMVSMLLVTLSVVPLLHEGRCIGVNMAGSRS